MKAPQDQEIGPTGLEPPRRGQKQEKSYCEYTKKPTTSDSSFDPNNSQSNTPPLPLIFICVLYECCQKKRDPKIESIDVVDLDPQFVIHQKFSFSLITWMSQTQTVTPSLTGRLAISAIPPLFMLVRGVKKLIVCGPVDLDWMRAQRKNNPTTYVIGQKVFFLQEKHSIYS